MLWKEVTKREVRGGEVGDLGGVGEGKYGGRS